MKHRTNLLILLLLLVSTSASAGPFKIFKSRKAKKAKTEVPAKPKSKYDKLLDKAGKETASSSFLTIHKLGDKLYIEYPIKNLGRDILIASTTAESSNSRLAMVGHKESDPIHVRFELNDSTLCMNEVNTIWTADEELSTALSRNYRSVTIDSYKVEAWNNDSTAVVVNMTKFFAKDNKLMKNVTSSYSILSVRSSVKDELTSIGRIKAFDDNATIETHFTYKYSLGLVGSDLADGNITTTLNRSLLLLPEDVMKPRISDTRVGIFLTSRRKITMEDDGIRNFSLANRWRLEPADTAAWLRGELVEPKKHIVWYVDDSFPEDWKEPLKKSVLIWNSAFEQLGFKNVMEARNFPKDDPEFDPDNLKYSCIRYIPIATQNAMGPSWVDPRSGEIINASVLVYNDVIKLINKWRFVQTAQIDPRVRTKKMPREIIDESLTYVFAHEIGHTLGLMHNMAASSSFPVDSLRSATFTRQYGTTPSIMDYARYNYVAQPEDKDVNLAPPTLGAYDQFAIKWLYSPLPGNKSAEEEATILEQWVDEKAGDPIYRYGRQQVYSRYDPSALEEDLGDDAVKAGTYGVNNLKYILRNMDKWITGDESTAHRQMLYGEIASQFTNYLGNALTNVGGIYLTAVKDGTPGNRHVSVPADIQRKSLLWVIDQLRHCQWIDAPEQTRLFPLRLSRSVMLANTISKNILDMNNEVLLSSHVAKDKPYTQTDYANDLYAAIWEPTLRGQQLTEVDRILQRAYVQNGTALVNKTVGRKTALTDDEDMEHALNLVREITEDAQHEGSRACTDICGIHFGDTDDFGLQSEIKTDAIDQSVGIQMIMMKKVAAAIRSRIASASATDRAHYQALLANIQSLNM